MSSKLYVPTQGRWWWWWEGAVGFDQGACRVCIPSIQRSSGLASGDLVMASMILKVIEL